MEPINDMHEIEQNQENVEGNEADKLVTFELLFKLSQDGEEGVDFADIIEALAMQGIEMSKPVIALGVSLGVLCAE